MKTTLNMDDEFGIKVKKYCEDNAYTLSKLMRVLLKERMERGPIDR